MPSQLQKTTFDFLRDLEKNNNREWFTEHKSRFIDAQENVLQFVTELLEKMGDLDDSFLKIDPKKTLFRIYRDTRFSKDKTPYKINFGASINGIGKKDGSAGYYLHIAPNDSFLAAGMYMIESPRLKKIRKEISEYPEDFLKIVKHDDFKNFEFTPEKLSRVPQGFDKEDPMAEFLKMKHYTVLTKISDQDLLQESAVDLCFSTFQKMSPLVAYLNGIEQV